MLNEPVGEDLHHRAALTVSRHPEPVGAAQGAHIRKDITQRQLFQPLTGRRRRENDLLHAFLKEGAQLIKAPVEAFLRGKAQVGDPVVHPLAGAHEADGDDGLSVFAGMGHADGLDGVAAFPLAQSAQHL